MTNKIGHSAATFLILMLICLPTVAAENKAEQEAKDLAQIEKLMRQYVRALDTDDADAYVAAYTPDGQFRSGANAVKGCDALKKMIRDFRQTRC
jgi:hypothetical protein